LYLEELDVEDVLKTQLVFLPRGTIKTKQDYEEFAAKIISEPMPYDRPQFKLWFSPDSNKERNEGCVFWKNHHSLTDGVSVIALNLQMDSSYDITKIMNFPDIPLWRRMLLRAMIPISIIQIILRQVTQVYDKNSLHDGKRDTLTGTKICAAAKIIDFKEVKDTSKTFGCTINDIMTCALSNSLSKYFAKREDKTKNINIMIPANIRWSMYRTSEEVKLENKFAPIPLTIPVESDRIKALTAVKRATKQLKSQFAITYCMYVLALVTSKLLPDFVCRLIADKGSLPYTMAFSNTPGLLKPVSFGDVPSLGFHSYVVPSGRIGICLAVITYADGFRLTLTADSGIMTKE
jgi:NRPS condensation-like uncharacterized protein